jgi:hypothetical protein
MTSRAPQRSLPAPKTREESLKKTVEDRFIMKNFILITALAMLTGTIVLIPLNAQAQSTPAQTAAQPDPKEAEFVSNWYDICFKKNEAEKCYQLSKELINKYPNADPKYIKAAKSRVSGYETGKNIEKFNNALNAFLASPQDPNKIEAFFTAGDDYLEFDRDPLSSSHLFALGRIALAGHRAVLTDVYKNPERVKVYTERAIKEFEAIPPEKFNDKEFTSNVTPLLRDFVLASSYQYLGYLLFQSKGDDPEAQNQVLNYITQAINVKNKENRASKDLPFGWIDPTNYNIRRNIYLKQYGELRKKYDALTDEQKIGDPGKELLKQINDLLDKKLIPEDARIIATATRPEYKELKEEATGEFNDFWKFRVDDPAKAPDFLKSFEADPTVEGPPVPAKAEDATGATAPNAPNVTGSTGKLAPGATAVPGTGTSKTNGTKATGGKTPPKSKPNTRRPRRKR